MRGEEYRPPRLCIPLMSRPVKSNAIGPKITFKSRKRDIFKFHYKVGNRGVFWGTGRDIRGMQACREGRFTLRFRARRVRLGFLRDASHTTVTFAGYFSYVYVYRKRGGT